MAARGDNNVPLHTTRTRALVRIDRMHTPPIFFAALFFLASQLLPSLAASHPLKLSASLIEYAPEKKSIRVECKVFIDDFERSLSHSVLNGASVGSLPKKRRPEVIEAYFDKFYHLTLNGTRLPLHYETVTPLFQQNILIIKFREVSAALKRGDKIQIQNSMFFRDFGLQQSNRITVRIPSFDIDEGRIATVKNYTFSYILGEMKK